MSYNKEIADGITITGDGTTANPFVGAGGSTPSLQAVTDVGNTTTNAILVQGALITNDTGNFILGVGEDVNLGLSGNIAVSLGTEAGAALAGSQTISIGNSANNSTTGDILISIGHNANAGNISASNTICIGNYGSTGANFLASECIGIGHEVILTPNTVAFKPSSALSQFNFDATNISGNRLYTLPDSDGIIPLSVNNVTPDTQGNITIVTPPYSSCAKFLLSTNSTTLSVITLFNNTGKTFTPSRTGTGNFILTPNTPFADNTVLCHITTAPYGFAEASAAAAYDGALDQIRIAFFSVVNGALLDDNLDVSLTVEAY